MFRLEVSPETRNEVVALAIELELNRSGFGEKFIRAYEQTIILLEHYPFSNRLRYRKSRAIQIPKFSYLLIYKVYRDAVLVQKLIHVKRSLRKQYKS